MWCLHAQPSFPVSHALPWVDRSWASSEYPLARRLVAATLDAAGDADWALLFTGTPEVYRSSGFLTFSMPRTMAGPWTAPEAVAESGAIARESVGLGVLGTVRDAYEHSRAGGHIYPLGAVAYPDAQPV